VRLHQQTFWLMAAQFVWGATVSGTVINAWVLSQREQGDPDGRAIFMAIMVVLGVTFGFFSYRVSLRVLRGPRRPLTNPHLHYFGTTLLAMFLADFIHVFGLVCGFYNTPFLLVLLTFFVPMWLLFAMSVPTRAKITRWTTSGA